MSLIVIGALKTRNTASCSLFTEYNTQNWTMSGPQEDMHATQNIPPIQLLPIELVSYIQSFLTSPAGRTKAEALRDLAIASQVCRLWYEASRKPSLWLSLLTTVVKEKRIRTKSHEEGDIPKSDPGDNDSEIKGQNTVKTEQVEEVKVVGEHSIIIPDPPEPRFASYSVFVRYKSH